MVTPDIIAAWGVGVFMTTFGIAVLGSIGVFGVRGTRWDAWVMPLALGAAAGFGYAAYTGGLPELGGLSIDPATTVPTDWVGVLLVVCGIAGGIAALAPRIGAYLVAALLAGFITRVTMGLVIRDGGFGTFEHVAGLPAESGALWAWVAVFSVIAFAGAAASIAVGDRRDGAGPALVLGLVTAGAMGVLMRGGNSVVFMTTASVLGLGIAAWLVTSRLVLGNKGGALGGRGGAIAAHASIVTLLWTGVFADYTPWVPAVLITLAPAAALVTTLPKARDLSHIKRAVIGSAATLMVISAAMGVVEVDRASSAEAAGENESSWYGY